MPALLFVSALDAIVVRRDQTYPFNKTIPAEGTIRPDNLWRLESDYVFSTVMPYTIVPLHFSARRARRGSATNPTRHAAFGSVVCQDARSLSED